MEHNQNIAKNNQHTSIDSRNLIHLYTNKCFPSYHNHNYHKYSLQRTPQNRHQLIPQQVQKKDKVSRNSLSITVSRDKLTVHDAKCYLVTCMDFRFLDYIVKFMDEKGLNTNYDQFILAGASLGFTQEKYPHWAESLLDHMSIGSALHNFREIIFIDHIDCGAYKKFYPQIQNNEQQIKYHRIHMQKARNNLSSKFSNFKFTGYLMNLKGQCQLIPVHLQKIYKFSQFKEKQNIQDHTNRKSVKTSNDTKNQKEKIMQKKMENYDDN